MVLPPQDALHLGQIFARVRMRQPSASVVLATFEHGFGLRQAKARSVQQTVADSHIDPEVRRIGQTMHIAHLQRHHQQTETRNGHGKRIQVHAGNRIQRLLGHITHIPPGLVACPLIYKTPKCSQQEVTGAAGRVDHPHLAEAELADSRRERAVEDELLDELGRLQQRIALRVASSDRS